MTTNRISLQVYRFVFVNTNRGYGESYALVETNIPMDHLASIEHKQGLTRFDTNHVDAFVKQANTFYHNQGDRYMKVITESQDEHITGYPLYYGYSGNY